MLDLFVDGVELLIEMLFKVGAGSNLDAARTTALFEIRVGHNSFKSCELLAWYNYQSFGGEALIDDF